MLSLSSSFLNLRTLISCRNSTISATRVSLDLLFPNKRFCTFTKQTHLLHPLRYCLASSCPSTKLGFTTSFSSTTPFLYYPVTTTRSSSAMASHSHKDHGSIYDFTVKDARGNDVDFSTYKGKVLLIVNVASKCGLTNSNYTELSQLYDKYKDLVCGLEILAFPCNQFGDEEPGNNEQILEFACTRFKAEYPIFDKVDVNGENAAPIYKFLKSSKGGLFGDGVKWNFTKFLVDKEGHVVERYAPTTSPHSIEKNIKKLLGVAA